MTNPLSQKPEKKRFLFDQNIFDEPEAEEEPEEDLPPPPPSFSEDELAAAKLSSYEEGKRAGFEEAVATREQKIAELLAKISGDTKTLFEQETSREKTYEAEAVRLCLAIFSQLFPLYKKHHDFDEMREALNQILKTHTGKGIVVVETSSGQSHGIEEHLKKIAQYRHDSPNFNVKSSDMLKDGEFKLSWSDGGAVRNSEKMAEEILVILEQTLAAKQRNSHDNNTGRDNGSGQSETQDLNEPESSADNPAQ